MTPSLRKFILTVHITVSVGWIGAVICFLVVVIATMLSQDVETLRAAWMIMGVIGPWVLIPLAFAALLTGIIMSVGTKWGLFQHYWVLFSLGLTILATFVLVGNMQSVSYFASLAADRATDRSDMLRAALPSELLHAGLGLLVLVVIQVLNIYKPRGVTPYGWRKQQEQRIVRQAGETAI